MLKAAAPGLAWNITPSTAGAEIAGIINTAAIGLAMDLRLLPNIPISSPRITIW